MRLKPVRFVLVMLILSLLGGLVYYSIELAKQPLAVKEVDPAKLVDDSIKKSHFNFTTNLQCKECHVEIWEELRQDQHFYSWFNSPFLAQDPKKIECNNCHAPQPILQTGVEEIAVIRNERFEEGVGCIECHKFNDEVHGPLPSREAACNPRFNPVFKESRVCNSCHAPHGSYDEWKSSKWAKEGITCQACHMPEVIRPAATGGEPKKGRSHKMLGPRNIEFIRSAVAFEMSVENGEITASVSNIGAAHNVPGEINNREIFLLITVEDKEGNELEKFRESFRAAPRPQRNTNPGTQLKVGETRSFKYKLEHEGGTVTAKLGYKLMAISFLMPDEHAPALYEKLIEF